MPPKTSIIVHLCTNRTRFSSFLLCFSYSERKVGGNIWRNCYHLANLHSGHVGRTPAAIAYIVYIGKNKLKPNTGHQALIGHQQLSDAVGLYGVFLHTRESRQFRWGMGHRSKSQNTKK